MIDQMLAKSYVEGVYNCGHFAAELWFNLTGQRKYQLSGEKLESAVWSLVPIRVLENPCLVFMRNGDLHVGVYTDGRVYHLTDKGVISSSVDSLQYTHRLSFHK